MSNERRLITIQLPDTPGMRAVLDCLRLSICPAEQEDAELRGEFYAGGAWSALACALDRALEP